MKSTFVLILFTLTISLNAVGQYIALDLKLNDCVSCRNNLSILNELSADIPTFVFFREAQKTDSLDLEYKFGLKSYNIEYIFNDSLYGKFHHANTSSTWHLLDANNNIIMAGDLKNIAEKRTLDSIKKIASILPPCTHCQYDFTDENIFIFNLDLDKLQIVPKDSQFPVVSIRPREFDFKYLLKSLHNNDSSAFVQKGFRINTNSTGFKPGFTWFDISPSNEIFIMLEYIQPSLKNDSFSYDIRTCLLKYDLLGNIKDVFPENFDSVKKYDNYSARFVFKNDHSYVTTTHDPKNWFMDELKNHPNKKIFFITQYDPDTDGTFKPVFFYEIDLPLIYKEKYYDNYMSPELCSFPYIAFRYSDRLYDLNTLKSCSIIDSISYNSHVDFTSKKLGDDKYAVLAVKALMKNDEVLVVYRLGTDVYIKSFNGQRETKFTKIRGAFEGHKINSCFIDPYSEQIYFTFEDHIYPISLPLALYGF